MRTVIAGAIVAACGLIAFGLVASGSAKADTVPPVKGNDTGGIIAYSLVGQTDVRAIAVDHCAHYGKVVKLTGVQPYYGGYVSFACIWVPPGHAGNPLIVNY